MTLPRVLLAALATAALAGCATAPGPVEVTRFLAPERSAQLGRGTIFVESAPGVGADGLELSTYKAAVMRELAQLGYVEADRTSADQIARVDLERYSLVDGRERGPVSVGVGGSTGSYGSGVGLGVGINLGGGGGQEVGTRLAVSIADRATNATLWEGRARFEVGRRSDLADPQANAAVVADALFREFPGRNGETVTVRVAR